MFIIKCDRCGKETKVNSFVPSDNMYMPKYAISTFENDEMKVISLCDECEKDFEKFLSSSRGIMNDK